VYPPPPVARRISDACYFYLHENLSWYELFSNIRFITCRNVGINCSQTRAHISRRRTPSHSGFHPPHLLYNRRGLTRSDSEFRRPEIWALYRRDVIRRWYRLFSTVNCREGISAVRYPILLLRRNNGISCRRCIRCFGYVGRRN
jgi:hypothetical protein